MRCALPEPRRLRSRDAFADPARSDMTAPHLERFMNDGITANLAASAGELRNRDARLGARSLGHDTAIIQGVACIDTEIAEP